MSDYIVSARKYRPDSFGTLVGQDTIAKTLKNSILRGQLAHAYLFCGPRGVGKTTTARIFAKMINCSNPSPEMEPCGECESCRSFAEGRSYCIHELDAASNNGVEDIKSLMEQVRIPPQVGKYSVYIIDEVHMLSSQAFNDFLKTLEEPPAHAIFILATTEKHKILPTILSRCQTYDFNRIGVNDIVSNLKMVASKENISIDDESLHVIAHKADGAMRDALTIFDQTVAFCGTDVKYQDVIRNLNVLDYEYSFSLVENFLAGDYPKALLTFDEILTKGFNALHFVAALSSHLRDLVVSKSNGLDSLLELPQSLKERYREQAGRCPMKFLYDALNITTQCEASYKASINQRLHIEFTLMKLCYLITSPAPAAPTPTPAAQAPVQTTVQAPTPVQTPTPAQVSSPAPAVQAPAPSSPAAVSTPAPETEVHRERRPRAARSASHSSLTLKGVMEGTSASSETTAVTADKPAPEEAQIRLHWKEMAGTYAEKPRLFNMLNSCTLKIEDDDNGQKIVTFYVLNISQKEWVETKLLHDLEGNLRRLSGSTRIVLKVDIVPQEENQKAEAYMPSEQAKELMSSNSEVKQFVQDFGLDIK